MYFIRLTKILAPKRLGFSCLPAYGGISEAVVDFSHKPKAQFIDLNKYNGDK